MILFDAELVGDDLKKVLEPTIIVVAHLYHVDPNWIKAIISKESEWNCFAVRYETECNILYQPAKFSSSQISLNTEVNTQKTSWGLGQVMGSLAREQGLTGFMAQLIIPEINLKHIAMRLADLKKRSSDPAYLFAGYNGGPGAMRKTANGLFKNQDYVNSTQKYLSQLV
jgi:soluble lytic murein transglycosylase-like protein